MSAHIDMVPLQLGDRAPNVVLDAITQEGKIALDDFRGQTPVLVGLFRGLHCAFCRRHIAAQARLDPVLRERGVESLTVVNTPIDRARLYFRYHPMPNLPAYAQPSGHPAALAAHSYPPGRFRRFSGCRAQSRGR